jgi:hypothetical protein
MSDFNQEMNIETEEFLLYVMKRFKFSREQAETHRKKILNKIKENKTND